MKKVILKSSLAVVAVATSCLGAWKVYKVYGTMENSLMLENIEALTQNNETPDTSWYQYLGYTHPCSSPGLKLYCSKLKNNNNDHCNFHCGRKISN